MKITLTNEQFVDFLRSRITESLNEKIKGLDKHADQRIKDKEDELARDIYQDKYNTVDDTATNKYFTSQGKKMTVDNNLNIPTGLFSRGNSKLSPDTLIVNFTSALRCPSGDDCPMSQLACYAVGIENQHPDARRKNLMIQKALYKCMAQGKLDKFFEIVEMYIVEYSKTKRPIKYIRYNEVGDFINQELLRKSAEFSDKMFKKYGILSMAYTSKKILDPTEVVNGKPIDQIIKINRSRNDIPRSEGSINQAFNGIPMPPNGFSIDPNINLENSYCNVVQVSDEEANKLEVEKPVKDENDMPSIPVLNYGKWQGGEGYYYVCPCSFWRYNKDKACELYLKKNGALSEDEALPETDQKKWRLINQRLPEDKVKELKSILNKITSPCGTKCAVCHNMAGGVSVDGKKMGIKDYVVLTATHGRGKDKYKPEYAEKKRNGDDTAIYDKENPTGREMKYNPKKTDAPIRSELIKE